MARSSIEAEYKAVVDAIAEFIWIKSLLQELHIPLQRSPILWCDNVGVTYFAANPVFHARTKHIEIYYHFIQEQVEMKNLRIVYMATKDHRGYSHQSTSQELFHISQVQAASSSHLGLAGACESTKSNIQLRPQTRSQDKPVRRSYVTRVTTASSPALHGPIREHQH